MNKLKITRTLIDENFQLFLDCFNDLRGNFEVFWEEDYFNENNIDFKPGNAHHSYNRNKNTIRAFHYQIKPFRQKKLVSCVSGRIWDVAVDVCGDSPTFGKWSAIEMSAESGLSHFIPETCAHGFITLEDHTTVAYLIEGNYQPTFARTLRWNDPTIAVPWPGDDPILSEKDARAPLFNSK